MKLKKLSIGEPQKLPDTKQYINLIDRILRDIEDFEQEHCDKFDGILTEQTGNKIKALLPELAKKYFE